MKATINVDYRKIAKMMASALPVDGEEFGQAVNNYLAAIRRMPTPAKLALKAAYIFSHRVPREEREDMFQDIVLAVLEADTNEAKLAYAVARCDCVNWWAKYKVRQHYSLDSVINDDSGNPVTMAELLVGEVEFELKLDGKMDAELMFDALPADIKPLIQKRLLGKPLSSERKRGNQKTDSALSNAERQRLNRWINKEGYKLLIS